MPFKQAFLAAFGLAYLLFSIPGALARRVPLGSSDEHLDDIVAFTRKLGETTGQEPLPDYTGGPRPNMTSKASICPYYWKENTENALQQALGFTPKKICTYGRYCGAGCSGNAPSVFAGKAWSDAPEDFMDQACFWHDKCFNAGLKYTILGLGLDCNLCMCNYNLMRAADQVYAGNACPSNDAESLAKFVKYYFRKSNNCTQYCKAGDEALPGVGTCGGDIFYETGLAGGDLSTSEVADWAECCSLCAANVECQAWTYTKFSCTLKVSGWQAQAEPNTISGTRLSSSSSPSPSEWPFAVDGITTTATTAPDLEDFVEQLDSIDGTDSQGAPIWESPGDASGAGAQAVSPPADGGDAGGGQNGGSDPSYSPEDPSSPEVPSYIAEDPGYSPEDPSYSPEDPSSPEVPSYIPDDPDYIPEEPSYTPEEPYGGQPTSVTDGDSNGDTTSDDSGG